MIEIAGIDYFKMEDIPVTFEYQGKVYHGILGWVPGRGGYSWDLTVNKFHWGYLSLKSNSEWQFTNQKMDMLEYAEYFGEVLIAWYE